MRGRKNVVFWCCLAVLLLTVVFVSSCGNRGEKGEEATRKPEQEEHPLAEIGPIVLEPQGSPDTSGVLVIPETVKVSVTAEGASKVVFYTAHAGEKGPGTIFWVDDRPEDGWGTQWTAPLAGTVFTITAVAYWDGETRESSVRVIWKKEEEETTPPGVEDEVTERPPFKLLASASSLEVVAGLPRYFLAGGWIDGKSIFGLTGTNPLNFDLSTGEYRALGFTAWSAELSPDGQRLIYLKDGALYAANIDGSGQKYLWPDPQERDPLFAGDPWGGYWSPEGKRILAGYQYEWDADFYLLHLDTGEAKPLETKLEDYFLTSAVGWAGEDKIVFSTRASRKKDGTREYSHGYRSDLAVYDLAEGSYRLITSAADGEFIEGMEASRHGILFLRWWNEGHPGEEISLGLMDTGGRVLWEVEMGQLYKATLSPNGKTAAFIVETEPLLMNSVCRLVLYAEGRKIEVAEFTASDYYSMRGPFWSPDGNRLLLSFTTSVLVDEKTGAYQEQYFTLVITP